MKLTWLGITVLIILFLFMCMGYKRGFIKEIVSFFFVFLALSLAWAINPYINEFIIEKTPVYNTIQETCTAFVQNESEEAEYGTEDQSAFINGLKLPGILRENIQKNKKENTLSYKDITSKDSQNYYMGKENDTITVSRPSYIASRVCSAAIYATCKTFKEATKCASKTLKRNYKKNI